MRLRETLKFVKGKQAVSDVVCVPDVLNSFFFTSLIFVSPPGNLLKELVLINQTVAVADQMPW